jgi:anaerobic magnesium-protoporphyrin IX monomethyl ester cyclase
LNLEPPLSIGIPAVDNNLSDYKSVADKQTYASSNHVASSAGNIESVKVEKILLIFPPAYTIKHLRDISPLPPLGIGFLAAIGEKKGFQVDILDALIQGWETEISTANPDIVRVGLTDADITKAIKEFAPDLVGVSCMFSIQHKIYPHILQVIKNADPEIITVAGGAHVTVCQEDVLSDPNCDYIITGEAEESFFDLIDAIQGKRTLESVDGLGWKQDGSELTLNPKVKWLDDLDQIPFPAYHIMKLERYFGLQATHGKRHAKEFAPIITSRGCPAKCSFCSANKMFGYKFRKRSVENIMSEIRFLKESYGVKEIMFEDDNVTAERKHATELFTRLIEEKMELTWDTPNGVGLWSLNEEMLDLMKESGCTRLNFPVESGDQEILKNIIKKPLDLLRVQNLLAHCRKIGLEYGMFLVIGSPGEKLSDIWTSFKFAAKAGCYNPHISVATPYPGTELYDQCKENDYFVNEYSLDQLFISSFMLETPDWTEKELRQTILKGRIYLIFKHIVDSPIEGLITFFKLFLQPRKWFNYLKRISKSGQVWRNPSNP